jgi:hypothetical protein
MPVAMYTMQPGRKVLVALLEIRQILHLAASLGCLVGLLSDFDDLRMGSFGKDLLAAPEQSSSHRQAWRPLSFSGTVKMTRRGVLLTELVPVRLWEPRRYLAVLCADVDVRD